MCKINNVTLYIKSLDFSQRGKMRAIISDGREIVVPLGMFPDIKALSLKDRNGWMILDDQFFTFPRLSTVYSLTDLFKLS